MSLFYLSSLTLHNVKVQPMVGRITTLFPCKAEYSTVGDHICLFVCPVMGMWVVSTFGGP